MDQKLTPQYVLKIAKRKLGLKSLPQVYSDEELLDILYEDTIPTFSIYFPYNYNFKVNLSECRRAEADFAISDTNNCRAYHLDLPYNMNVIEVADVQYAQLAYNSYYYPTCSFGDSYDIFVGQVLQGQLESMMTFNTTWEFHEPDILVINSPVSEISDTINLSLLITHSSDMSTIKFSYKDFIIKLFMIDLKIALYEELKRYDKIDTTFNQIDLKIDKWEDAENERETLLEEWEGRFLSHRKKTIYRV